MSTGVTPSTPSQSEKLSTPVSTQTEVSTTNVMKKEMDANAEAIIKNDIEVALLKAATKNGLVIECSEVQDLLKVTDLSTYDLLQKLVPIAKNSALPLISQYKVGAAGIGKTGNIYLGFNLESKGLPLSNTVHAEQSLVVIAR